MKPSSQTAFMIIVVLLLMAADLCAGGVGLGLPDRVIFVKLRLPRMLTAVLAGASLALAGLQMQSIFRNPLADPHIMGVSAGAGTGAAVATLIVGTSLPAALSGLTVVSAAFIGALLSSLLVMMVSSRMQSATTLLIFGVMLGFVFSAITSILEYSANAESLKVFYHVIHDAGGNGKAVTGVTASLRIQHGVDADQFALLVHQSAAGIAGIDGCVRLNETLNAVGAQ